MPLHTRAMTEPAANVPPPPAVPRQAVPWLWLATTLAVLALAIAGWNAYSNRQDIDGLRQELAKRLADVDAQSKASRAAGDQLREATREAQVKIGVLEGKLAESQSQQIALEALYQDLSRNRDEWAFAEIEQTLLVASQQLQLAGNVRAALIAKAEGIETVIVFNNCGHGFLDRAAYENYLAGKLEDLSLEQSKIEAALNDLPKP